MKVETKKFAIRIYTNADLVSDTGWHYAASARPNRGLHDYERTITFSEPLTDRERERLENAIKSFDNPGYCSWAFRHDGNGVYRLFTVMDSSD